MSACAGGFLDRALAGLGAPHIGQEKRGPFRYGVYDVARNEAWVSAAKK
jgi:hypothetical protein